MCMLNASNCVPGMMSECDYKCKYRNASKMKWRCVLFSIANL